MSWNWSRLSKYTSKERKGLKGLQMKTAHTGIGYKMATWKDARKIQNK